MQTIERTGRMRIGEAAADFLACRRIAVTGVSAKNPAGHGANAVYERLREHGCQVFAVNPNAETVAGDHAYPDLKSIAGGVEAVVIGTSPEHAMATIQECADLGIHKVWMHRSIDSGSVSPAAVAYGRERGMTVIAGGCPLMFDPVADGAHKGLKFFCTLTGAVPRQV
jgi:uncharacterized protein